jgi:non-ribosomal peptide synthetase component F
MWAGGDCVTRGYLNLPDKTSERYKADPFVHDGSLMFNTGDLGYLNSKQLILQPKDHAQMLARRRDSGASWQDR